MESQVLPQSLDLLGRTWVWVLNPLHFGAIIMPGMLLVIATSIRWALKLPFTCWADTLLAFVAFDATVIVDSGGFRAFFRNAELAKHVVGIHLVFLLAAIVAWILLIWRAEKFLVPARVDGQVRLASFVAMSSGVVAVALLLVFHVATYISGG